MTNLEPAFSLAGDGHRLPAPADLVFVVSVLYPIIAMIARDLSDAVPPAHLAHANEGRRVLGSQMGRDSERVVTASVVGQSRDHALM
jgi:hypothetical protein